MSLNLEWCLGDTMPGVPTIDLGRCTDCESCVELCPEVFRYNEAGYLEVADLPSYTAACIDEAISMCPADCISWVEEP